MKVSSSISPLAFTLETNPRRPNFRLARFHENAIETESGWEYDEYCLELPASDTLEAEVETNYDAYLRRAMEGASAEEFTQAARNAALRRIEGKCSAAIYAGATVNGKHYRLTENDQLSLNAAIGLATSTGKAVSYASDGEAAVEMTAAELAVVGKEAYDWGYVCRNYYAYLKQYIAAETDVEKLAEIDFGKALPDSYMQQLAALLNSAGIDITKYSGLFK